MMANIAYNSFKIPFLPAENVGNNNPYSVSVLLLVHTRDNSVDLRPLIGHHMLRLGCAKFFTLIIRAPIARS